MADAVSDLLQQYYGMPDALGGNVQPRQHRPQPFDMYGEDARQEQLGQHNLIPRIPGGLSALLSLPGQASVDAIDNAQRGRISPQQAAWDFMTNGPVGPFGMVRIPNPLRAFHGSPHTFDQFDTARIGTGEGAQAYGHGLYFAENEGVARSYRDALSVQSGDPVQNSIRWAMGETGNNVQAAIAKLRGSISFQEARGGLSDAARQRHMEAIRRLEDGSHQGRMYEVNLHARPEQFLDWDAPLSRQSERVRNFIASQPASEWLYHGADSAERLGRMPYSVMYQLKQPHATSALQEAGIPGIQYLDQGSRNMGPRIAAQERHVAWLERQPNATPERLAEARQHLERLRSDEGQTRNFVVFNPEIIEILRRYGIAGPVTTAGILSQYNNEPEPSQP